MGTVLWQGVGQANASAPGGVALAFAVPVTTNDATPCARLRLLHQLARELGYEVRRITPPPPTTGHAGIRRAIAFIAAHSTEPLTVGMVAKYAGLCPQQFRKCFEQKTGITCWQYLNLRRIERAKELLFDPRRKVTNVSFESGFQSLSPFYRAFQKTCRANGSGIPAQACRILEICMRLRPDDHSRL